MKKNICKYIIIFNFFCVVDDQKNDGDLDCSLTDNEDDIDDTMDTPSGRLPIGPIGLILYHRNDRHIYLTFFQIS